MKHRSLLYCLTILSVALLCLALAGCATQPQQPEGQQPEQPAATEAPEQTAPPAAETAQSAAPAQTAPVRKTSTAAVTPKAAPAPVVRKTTLAAGTPIKVVTSSALSTKTNQSGDAFEAILNEAIVDGAWTIAKRGATVRGIVSQADPGGRVKGVATMTLKLTSLTLADGREVSLDTNSYSVAAKTTKKKDATKIGIGAGIGAAIGAIAGGGKGAAIGAGVGGAAGTGAALATHGDPAVVAAETLITFELAEPLQVTGK